MSFTAPSSVSAQPAPQESPFPLSSPFLDSPQPVLTLALLRQTGLGLKLRFFLALSCLALVPAIPLALILIGGGTTAPFLSGRNAVVCVLAIFVTIVLVATWVALPIIRPIRRATRQMTTTTQAITTLAHETLTIADEHHLGMTIIAGASTKLASRRQAIIRDCQIILRGCQGLQTRTQPLFQALPHTAHTLVSQEAILQTITDIATLAHSIATGLENDRSLEGLQKAMSSAHDFSHHFQHASTHLQQEAEQIEEAAYHLL